MDPVKNAAIYPRPFDVPRVEPEGRCCAGLYHSEKIGALVFDRGSGCFSIINPVGIVLAHGGLRFLDRILISVCPFCGFQWNFRSPTNELYTPPAPRQEPPR